MSAATNFRRAYGLVRHAVRENGWPNIVVDDGDAMEPFIDAAIAASNFNRFGGELIVPPRRLSANRIPA